MGLRAPAVPFLQVLPPAPQFLGWGVDIEVSQGLQGAQRAGGETCAVPGHRPAPEAQWLGL